MGLIILEMKRSTVEICSSLAEILTLTWEQAQLVWYKVSGKGLLHGIEWSSLSAELFDKHSTLFTADEAAGLSGDDHHRKEAVRVAMKRNPQSVLHAIYKSLWDTRGCGGALQHASIAQEIEKHSECACFVCTLELVSECQCTFSLPCH